LNVCQFFIICKRTNNANNANSLGLKYLLCEARQEKTREYQTQLLQYFSKCDNESKHHHQGKKDKLIADHVTQVCEGLVKRGRQRASVSDKGRAHTQKGGGEKEKCQENLDIHESKKNKVLST